MSFAATIRPALATRALESQVSSHPCKVRDSSFREERLGVGQPLERQTLVSLECVQATTLECVQGTTLEASHFA